MAKELLKRSQVLKEDTWKLEDLYGTEEAFLADADQMEGMIEELKGFKQEQVTGSGAQLLACYQKLEKLVALLDRGINY